VIIRVDPDSTVAPYEQIREQIATMVSTGGLPEGLRLPPIRQLAADLVLADGTVARAYRELERDRWIVSRGRHGTFVDGARNPGSSRDRDRQLRKAAKAFAVRAAQLRVDRAAALRMVREALRSTGRLETQVET
jgi:DNA-binding transcriptional regulator YhcF (GntR family)